MHISLVPQENGPHDSHPGTLELLITDDGLGFDADNLDSIRMEQAGHGSGLRDMAKRAKESGGACTVTSGPGQGTRITITVPTEEPGDHDRAGKEEA